MYKAMNAPMYKTMKAPINKKVVIEVHDKTDWIFFSETDQN